MHVSKLKARNVKNLRAVDVDLDEENVVTIKGPNGAGKSSILDAIWWALGGARVHDDEPIRDGQDEAEAVVEINGYKVKRRWTEKSTYLDVTDAQGREYQSPQSLLNDFAESFMFDPLEFVNMHSSDQKAKLLEISGHQEELEELEDEYDEVYAERRDINRDVKDLQGQVKGIDVDPELADEEVPSTSELVSDLEEAKDLQARKKDLEGQAVGKRQTAKEKREKAQQLLDEADTLEEEADEAEEEAEDIEVPDIEALQERVDEADEKRDRVEKARELVELSERLEEREAESEAKSARLEEIEEEKQEIIQGADLPEGIGFEDEHVTYEGVPLDQASMGEQIRVSMELAMHMDPDLRIIQVRNGSLMDDKTRQEVMDLAEEMDFQLFLELVGTDGEATIRIEDGEVVN